MEHYTRDEIAVVAESSGNFPPHRDLQLCTMIFTEDNSFVPKLLDKTYYNPKPRDDMTFYRTHPKNFDSRKGLGRGRVFNARMNMPSFELEHKWPLSSRAPVYRSRFSSDNSNTCYPEESIFCEQIKTQSVSETQPINSPTDCQYYPDELYDNNDPQTNKQDNPEAEVSESHQSKVEHLAVGDELDIVKLESNLNRPPSRKISVEPFTISSEVIPIENQVTDLPILPLTNSEERLAPISSQNRYPNHFSFLNPSEFPFSTDEETTNFNDNSPGSSNSQDPRHLWYYIDPRSNVQGPFLSEQMDGWYTLKYFPPTLFIWRECDSEAFHLSNLLNITGDCSEPFSVGAEILLISKDFSPVEDRNHQLQNEITFEENLFSEPADTFQKLNLERPSYISGKGSDFHEKNDINNEKFDTYEEKFKITLLKASSDEASQACSTPSDLAVGIKNEQDENDRKELISPQPSVNVWLQGPPKIPEHTVDCTSYDSNHISDKSKTHRLNRSFSDSSSEEPRKTGLKITTQPKFPEGTTKEKLEQKTSPLNTNNNPSNCDSKSCWTKVGAEKKQKKKLQKESDANLMQFPKDMQDMTSDGGPASSHNIKLDELDSFSMRKMKKSQNFKIPIKSNEVSMVNFSGIISEQSNEESQVKLNLRQNSPQSTFLDFERQKQRNFNSPWGSAPKETISSFLDIESDQKKDINVSEIPNKVNVSTNSRPIHQQNRDRISSWASITKSSEERMSAITSKKASRRNTSIISSNNGDFLSPNDEVFKPMDQDSGRLRFLLSKSKQEKSTYTFEHATRPAQDGIMLSKSCYEWVTTEISQMNDTIDPPTTVHLLQGFANLFEMILFGSDLFGTSEKTNNLCRRIWEDLNKGKKVSVDKQKKSQIDEWVKVTKKSQKISRKKKSKCSKTSVD